MADDNQKTIDQSASDSQFNVVPIPYHEHTGIDVPKINANNLTFTGGAFPLINNSTVPTITTTGAIASVNGNLEIYNGSAWVPIPGNPFSFNSSLIPTADNAFDLGSPSYGIRNIYLDGNLNGGSITNYFGNGSDGDVVISAGRSLSRDMFYNNLTINSGITLNPNGYRIWVKGTLLNNGIIARDGNSASGITGGAALAGGTIAGGAAGGNGGAARSGTTNANGADGSAGGASGPSIGSGGAAGGKGGGIVSFETGGTGGGPGSSSGESLSLVTNYSLQSTNQVIPPNSPQTGLANILVAITSGSSSSYSLSVNSGSGGGGSGGYISGGNSCTSGYGGGGGSSGGVIEIIANNIINNLYIHANGGNGANGGDGVGTGINYAVGEGGGGGGGSGGTIILIYKTYSGTGSVLANGGIRGLFGSYALNGGGFTMITGTNGTNGANGNIYTLQLP